MRVECAHESRLVPTPSPDLHGRWLGEPPPARHDRLPGRGESGTSRAVERPRLRLTDDQRRRLAAKAKRLGRQALNQIATIVTPDTLMRWHRRLIAMKWTFAAKRVGRPGLMRTLAELIVRMARENSRWGYCRIQGELKGLGHRVAPSTIAKVLKENGIAPAPDRPSSWRTFLQAQRVR